VPALSPTDSVAGRHVAIDPGHGGVDPGAVGQGGTLEKEIVLDIALKLKPLFEQGGVSATLTREEDIDLGSGTGTLREQKRADLAARVALANESGADVFISLHANSFPSPKWSGAQTFYYPGRSESESLAIAIQAELVKLMPGNGRKAGPGEYYVLEHANMPAAVVEVGFLSNPREEELLRDSEYRAKIAEAIFRGVLRFLAQRPT